MSKYHTIKTTVDGITFASKAEAQRYCLLKLLERHGAISKLELQPRFKLMDGGRIPGDKRAYPARFYVADFAYDMQGQRVIEDVKGVRTPMYVWKRQQMWAKHGIVVQEVA